MAAMRRRKNRTRGVLPQGDLEPVRSVTNPVGAGHARENSAALTAALPLSASLRPVIE